jgi:hypothetical protein
MRASYGEGGGVGERNDWRPLLQQVVGVGMNEALALKPSYSLKQVFIYYVIKNR